jgi:hypothetical protein
MSRLSVIIVFLLSSCQLIGPRDAGWTMLGNGYYQLIDTWPGPAQQLLQQVSWSKGLQQQQFTVSVLLQPDAMLLVALSPLGQEIWRLHYATGHRMTLSGVAPFNQPDFARRLLAEMQLALFSDVLLATRLRGLTLQQDNNRRLLLDRQQNPVLRIEQPQQFGAGQTITLQGEDYRLQIVTLQQDFMP